jgi:hypothetical protein
VGEQRRAQQSGEGLAGRPTGACKRVCCCGAMQRSMRAAGSRDRQPSELVRRGRLTHAGGEPAAAVRKRGKHRSSGTQVNELIGRTIW